MAGLPWIKVYTDLPRDPRSLHLADLLADARAWTYVLQMRLYLAEHAASGEVSGPGAVATVERSAGWAGERGRLVDAMRDAGFVRAGPARDGEGTLIQDADWLSEQGAHVAKVERDAKKPRGNTHNVASPSRDIEGTRAGPAPTPRGESRELRVEREATTLPAARAPGGGQAALPGLPAALPAKKPRAPRTRPPAKAMAGPPPDPRHAPLSAALVAHGWPHHGGRTAKAIKALLAHAHQHCLVHGGDVPGEVLRRAAIAKAYEGYPRVRELHELAERWGHFETQPQPARGPSPPSDFENPRPGSPLPEYLRSTPEEVAKF